MSDQQQDQRMVALGVMRQKAFDVGGSLGSVLSKSFELVMRVVQVGIEDEVTINHALESLENERTLSIRYDANANDRLNEVVYGLSDSMAVMIEELLAKRRRSLGLAPAPRVSPNHSNTDSSNDSHDSGLFRRVKEEAAEEPRVELITLDDGPSTSAQARAKSQPRTSRRDAAAIQKAATPLPSAMRASSTVRPMPAQLQKYFASRSSSVVSAATNQKVRFSDTNTSSDTASAMPPPASTQRIRREDPSPDVKPQSQPVSSIDAQLRAQEEAQSSSHNTRKAKRSRRTFVDYDEDNLDDDGWEELSETATIPMREGMNKAFECFRCDKSFDTKHGLAVHAKVHDGIQCTLCKFRMKPESMDKHMATKHRIFARAASMPAAVFKKAAVAVNQEDMDVDVVGDEEPVEDAVPVNGPILPTTNGSWVCDRCDRVFTCKLGLNRHYVTHTGSQCQICRKFMRTVLLDGHMDRIHNGGFAAPLSAAPRASSVFAYASNYGMVSDDEEEIPREEEDEEYRPNGAPKGRARSMSVARPRATSVAAPRGAHVCTQCDKSFQTLGGLSKHERVHLRGLDNRERFVCDLCPVSRLSNCLLNDHKRSVHGINPYECSCGVSFARKAPLVEHMRRMGHKKSSNSRQSVQPESQEGVRDARAGTSFI